MNNYLTNNVRPSSTSLFRGGPDGFLLTGIREIEFYQILKNHIYMRVVQKVLSFTKKEPLWNIFLHMKLIQISILISVQVRSMQQWEVYHKLKKWARLRIFWTIPVDLFISVNIIHFVCNTCFNFMTPDNTFHTWFLMLNFVKTNVFFWEEICI